MVRRLVVAALALAVVSLHGVHAQDGGNVIAETPKDDVPETLAPVDTTAPIVTELAAPIDTTVSPIVLEAATTPPVAIDATPLPATPEPAPSTVPVPLQPVATEAASVTAAPVTDDSSPASTESPTTMTPTATPSTAPVALDTTTTKPPDTTLPPRTFRNSVVNHSASPSLSSSQDSAADDSTSASPTLSSSFEGDTKNSSGTFKGFSFSKVVAISILGGVGLLVLLLLLCVMCRARRREFPDLNTPTLAPNAYPAVSIIASTSPSSSVWKSTRSTFASRDLPLASSIRAKLKGTTRSSVEYDRPHPISLIANLPHDTSAMIIRESNASDQSLSLRGCSEFSVHHQGDSDVSGRYSTSDRYSTKGRYSTTSRLSSEPERSNSGRVQPLVSKAVDVSRFSSSSSTPSSAAATRHNRVSLATYDRSRSSRTDASQATDGPTVRTDVPDWYRVIKSPADNDRYTTTSLVSDNTSSERDSFEL